MSEALLDSVKLADNQVRNVSTDNKMYVLHK